MAYKFNPFTGTFDEKIDVGSEIDENISLKNNYLSNDGDDEGILLSDTGQLSVYMQGSSSLTLNGSNQYIDLDDILDTTFAGSHKKFTIGARIKPATISGVQNIVSKFNSAAGKRQFSFYQEDGRLKLQLTESGSESTPAIYSVDGFDNYSVRLNSVGGNIAAGDIEYVNFGDIDTVEGIPEISWSFWVKFHATSSGYEYPIISKGEYYPARSGSSWGISYNTNNKRFYMSFGEGTYSYATLSEPLADDTWYHIVVGYKFTSGVDQGGGTAGFGRPADVEGLQSLYINGQPTAIGTPISYTQNAQSWADGFKNIPSTGKYVKIGAETVDGSDVNNKDNYALNGQIRDVAIWADYLSASEVTTIYGGGAGFDLSSDTGNYASSAALKCWWKFDETIGTAIADYSGNANNGNMVNTDDSNWTGELSTGSSGNLLTVGGGNAGWYHVGATVDLENDTYVIYKDGIDIGSYTAGVAGTNMGLRNLDPYLYFSNYSAGAETGDKVQIGEDTTIDDIFDGGGSFSVWFYCIPASPSSYSGVPGGQNKIGGLISKGRFVSNSNAAGWRLYAYDYAADGGNFSLEMQGYRSTGNDSNIWKSDVVFAYNTWHHVVVTYNSDATTNDPILYKNGAAITFAQDASDISGDRKSESAHPLLIGNQAAADNGASNSRVFSGYIDEVAIWNTVLTAADITKMYNTGTPSDLTRSYKYDSTPSYALNFNGSDEYVTVSDQQLVSTIGSVSAWIKLSAVGATRTVAGKFDTSSKREWLLQVDSAGKVIFTAQEDKSVFAENTKATSTTTLSTNTWYHVLGTFSPTNNVKIYINGELEATSTHPATNGCENTDTPIYIGWVASGGGYFSGQISNVAVWDAELTQADITSIHSGGKGIDLQNVGTYDTDTTAKAGSNLKAWWKMENGTGVSSNAVTDSAGGNYHGTPSNMDASNWIGLMGYWRFGENTGSSAADSGVNSNTGTITTATWGLRPTDIRVNDLDDTDAHLSIGSAHGETNVETFNGTLDEVAIWNTNLSDVDIAAVAQGNIELDNPELYGSSDTAENLVGYWKLDQGEGSVAYDSKDSNDGALRNSPTWAAGAPVKKLEITRERADFAVPIFAPQLGTGGQNLVVDDSFTNVGVTPSCCEFGGP